MPTINCYRIVTHILSKLYEYDEYYMLISQYLVYILFVRAHNLGNL